MGKMAMRTAYAIVLSAFIGCTSIGTGNADNRTTDDTRKVPLPAHDPTGDPVLVINGGTLIVGQNGRLLENGRVVIRGDRILRLGSSKDVELPDVVSHTIDAEGLFVLPD